MAKAISIPVASDTREFATGVKKGVIDPLEDAADALDDVARQGDKAGDKLERAFEDARDEVSEFKREQSELGKAMSKASREAGDDWSKNTKRGFDDGKDAMGELRDEADGTAREVAASFDGSAESIVGGFQELSANAFAGFGPAGAAAGLLAAAGLGVAMTAITEQQEAVEELRRKFEEAYKQAAEDGRAFLDEAQIQAAAIDILFDSEARKKAQEEAKTVGLDLLTLVRAQAGDQEALNSVIDASVAKEKERLEALEQIVTTEGIHATAADRVLVKAGEIKKKYEEQLGIQRENEQAARDALKLQEEGHAKERENIKRAQDADQRRYEAMAKRYSQPLPAPKIETPVVPAPDMHLVNSVLRQKHLVKLEAAVFTRNGTRVY